MQLISKLKDNHASDIYPFHMPGHKRRLAGDDLLAQIYGIDITEIEGFDNLHDPKGMIRKAEENTAALFGADETHFLVNGSTGGILAAICATVTSGDNIIIASNCHRSVYNAVMLSGAKLTVITPESEAYYEISGGIEAGDIKRALSNTDGSVRTAVVITSPTYEGITSDVKAIADVCHEAGAVLIVDAAHGAHLGFSDRFPQSPVSAGADVVVTSVHKTLPAMTQTALIHIGRNCPSADRIRKMLTVFMTSSPSYVLMSSIDSMTRLLKDKGEELFGEYTGRLDDFYDSMMRLECLSVLSKEKLTASGSADHDRSKIVVSDMTGLYSGKMLYDLLLSRYGICAEMATGTYVILMTSIADTTEGFERLKTALFETDELIKSKKVTSKDRGIVKRVYDKVIGKHIAKLSLDNISEEYVTKSATPDRSIENDMKKFLFDDREYIPVELSEGRVSADFVSIYPPGIPLMIPGETVTPEVADKLLKAKKDGLDIIGLNNGEIAVKWERSSI